MIVLYFVCMFPIRITRRFAPSSDNSVRLNEAKTAVAEKSEAAFGMGFVLPIEEREALQLKMSREEYLEQIEALVSGVRETLTTILLYREENAFTVVRRMEDVYGVIRRLRSIKNPLQRGEV